VVAKMALDLNQPGRSQEALASLDHGGLPDHHRPARLGSRRTRPGSRSVPAVLEIPDNTSPPVECRTDLTE